MPPKSRLPPPPPPPRSSREHVSRRVTNSQHINVSTGRSSLEEALAQRRASVDAAVESVVGACETACEASEHVEGGQAREIRRVKAILSDKQLTELGDGIVAVDVCPDAVNDTPDPTRTWIITEMDGTVAVSLGDETLRCETCGILFGCHSQLFAHQGKACAPQEQVVAPHCLRVSFDVAREPLLRPFLTSSGLTLTSEAQLCATSDNCSGTGSFIVDVSQLQRTLKQARYAECSAFNLEQWYEVLKSHTAESIMIALSDTDLQVLKALRAAWHVGSHAVDEETMKKYESLRDRIQAAGWGDAVQPCSYFVKTSMRSPKDAYKIDHDPDDPPHVRLRKEISACSANNAGDALELLLGSRRVAEDIANYERYRCNNTASGTLNLILREWDESIVNSIEWRCFVVEGKVTVISQYHCYDLLPEIVSACEDIGLVRLKDVRSRILDFQQSVHEGIVKSIGVPSYVLDVAASLDGGPIRCIEINPSESSGAALFNWQRDTTLIFKGRCDGQTEMRVARTMKTR